MISVIQMPFRRSLLLATVGLQPQYGKRRNEEGFKWMSLSLVIRDLGFRNQVGSELNPVTDDSIIPFVFHITRRFFPHKDHFSWVADGRRPRGASHGCVSKCTAVHQTANKQHHKHPSRTEQAYRDGGFAGIFPVLQQ